MRRALLMYLQPILFLVLVSAIALESAQLCQAQDDDEDDSAEHLPTASLNLSFDSHGDADIKLWLDQTPPDPRPIQAGLAQSVNCPLQAFTQPSLDQRALASWSHLKPEQRAKYEKLLNDNNRRQFKATCNHVLASTGWLVSGTMPLQPLADALAQSGERQLLVRVLHPKSAFEEHTSHAQQVSGSDGQSLNYLYQLGAGNAVPPLHLAYGYRPADRARQCAISAGFLLLPILLILWMRRAALKDAFQDPTAAWFSYFKTLQWCINGTMLLWMVARTSFREGLQNLLAFRLPDNGWQAALAQTLVILVPPWLVYLLCLWLSYKVFVQVRGNHWTRREFMLERALEVGARFLPFMFFFAALDFLRISPKVMVVLLLTAYISHVVCLRAKIRVSRSAPEALTTGELRDRIFALAKQASVNIKQVFVVGVGRAQVANAYATGTQIVMFTDYLLKRLTKREVDAIAGHELSHLRHGHPKKLSLMIIAVILFPYIFRAAWTMLAGWVAELLMMIGSGHRDLLMQWYWLSPKVIAFRQLDLLLIVAGFGVFYLMSRHFERVADEGSVRLVADPEAMITALLKVSRLNLTPIQWGKVTGSTLTHPTTLRRVEHIAQVGNVAPQRVQQLLAHHAQEEQARRSLQLAAGIPEVSTSALRADEEHYVIPSDARSVVSTMTALRRSMNHRWLLIAANVLPPALVAWMVQKLNLHGRVALLAYLAGAVLILAAYSLLTLRLNLRGRQQLRDRFIAKFAAEGIQVRGRDAILNGFSPGAFLRVYLSGYDWDQGFVWLLQDRLVYLGDKLRFALKPEHVSNVYIGHSAPGWWFSERVYLDWNDAEHGRQGTFSLYPNDPSSATKIKHEGRDLCAAIQRWRSHAGEYPGAPAAVQTLESPVLGEVTSQDPKHLLSRGRRLKTFMLLCLFSYGASVLLNVSALYGFTTVLLLSIYNRIPHWRYRIPPPTAPLEKPQSARAQAAGSREN